ncbi:DUF6676 family protein [Corynebacterium sp. ES2775-CONJ]|uniref:Rv1476 family membrane protein n=1 Tax=Corynebacterium sp. ES2775-CONJ TaxID=2974029 RepID=UPI002168951B|nr:DUF6676 family protein [Corynebacterium sp. ES2775-CONJ]MCS4489312.1 hypothetical protein [Corynebacterium sp. ES2775-CONJ]
MIPSTIDMNDLARQLAEDDVALETQDDNLHDTLESAKLYLEEQTMVSPVGVVVVDQTPPQPADLRDIGQVLLDAGGYELVIVRSPDSSGVVSTTLSRAEIESAKFSLVQSTDYAGDITAFADTLAGGNPMLSAPLVPVLVFSLVAAGIIGSIRKIKVWE